MKKPPFEPTTKDDAGYPVCAEADYMLNLEATSCALFCISGADCGGNQCMN